MRRRQHSADALDTLSIAGVAALFLLHCAACAAYSALFVSPRNPAVRPPRDLTVAEALLASESVPPAAPPCDLSSLQYAAVAREIMDPRERPYLFARREDFAADLRMVRDRWRELADAPPAVDSLRFPGRPLIDELLAFNRAFRRHVEDGACLYPASAWEIGEALQEVDRLYEAWDALRDARCDFYHVTVRRRALKKLREAIGPRAYYSGCMPAIVPVWRCRRID